MGIPPNFVQLLLQFLVYL